MRGKGDRSYELVSEADLASERTIVQHIRDAFPDDAVLAEESHHDDASAPRLWVVDPLDGTNNFAHHVPHFAVSIAFYEHGAPICGVVFNPARDDWFEASAGQGAFYNGEPMQVADHTLLEQSLIGVGFYYDRGAMMEATLAAIGDLFRAKIHGIRRFGTAALDLAQVAAGGFGAFFEYELSPWDFAAGRLLIEEAGGKVTTCQGDSLPLRKSTILASNGPLHQAMLDLVGPKAPVRE